MRHAEDMLTRYREGSRPARLDLYMEHRTLRTAFDRVDRAGFEENAVPEALSRARAGSGEVAPVPSFRRFWQWCCSLLL